LSYILSDFLLMPVRHFPDYSDRMVSPISIREFVMARYLHIAFGALLLSLACASTYELCSENVMSPVAAVYQLR
jgi:hypothetical protein